MKLFVQTSDINPKSDNLLSFTGSQIFSTADAGAKVPVTIEADPKVVNLYFVIVNRDRNGKVNTEVVKKVKKVKSPAQHESRPKARKRPTFPYHAVATRRPKTHAQTHKEVRHVTKKPKRTNRMCKKRGKKPKPCSKIKLPKINKFLGKGKRNKYKSRRNRNRP